MVDNKYLARGSKSKHYLEDETIRKMFLNSQAREKEIAATFEFVIASHPIILENRKSVHFNFMAAPVFELTENAIAWMKQIFSGDNFHSKLRDLERIWYSKYPGEKWFLNELGFRATREEGIAFTSETLFPNRVPLLKEDWSADYLQEFQFFENGLFTYLDGAMSFTLPTGVKQMNPLGVVLLLKQIVSLLNFIASELQYFGEWSICLVLSGLPGVQIASESLIFSQNPLKYPMSRKQYKKVMFASHIEISENQDSIIRELLGSFLRTTQSEKWATSKGLLQP